VSADQSLSEVLCWVVRGGILSYIRYVEAGGRRGLFGSCSLPLDLLLAIDLNEVTIDGLIARCTSTLQKAVKAVGG